MTNPCIEISSHNDRWIADSSLDPNSAKHLDDKEEFIIDLMSRCNQSDSIV